MTDSIAKALGAIAAAIVITIAVRLGWWIGDMLVGALR